MRFVQLFQNSKAQW